MEEIKERNWVPQIEVISLGDKDVILASDILDEDELPPWIIT